KEIYSAVGDNTSAIKETQTSITNLDEAIGQRFTEIRTEVNQAQADIASNSQAISNTNKAFAENKTQVQAKFDEQEGMIQEKMQATFEQSGDGIVAHSINITIKHDGVSYNAAGQVISAQVKNGKLESFFGYNANNFAWYNPVNGKMELFMYAKNGQMFIRDLFIEDGSITNAKIGNVIQSNNYAAGKSGWIINKNGYAEFQNIKARGEIEATSGRLKNVVIEESCEIKGTLTVNNIKGDVVKTVLIEPNQKITIEPEYFNRIISGVVITYNKNKMDSNYSSQVVVITPRGKFIVARVYLERHIYENKWGERILYIPITGMSSAELLANETATIEFVDISQSSEPAVVLISKK
uniref:phage tail tip fiber protein n=1 Tax=Proteus terrae TaxID=1574161 RepID=UPI0013006467